MPTTMTLKNIPDAVYERLKHAAEARRRSMNSEANVCLEAVLLPARPTTAERLTQARALRASLSEGHLPRARSTGSSGRDARDRGRLERRGLPVSARANSRPRPMPCWSGALIGQSRFSGAASFETFLRAT